MATVRISIHTVGQSFATCGVVVDAATGETLAETRDYPYGFTAVAYDAAEELARKLGHTVEEAGR